MLGHSTKKDKYTLLCFPAVMPECLRVAREYSALEFTVVGASSLNESFFGEDNYQRVHNVPYIHEPDFTELMSQLISDEKVDFVFCPHPNAYNSMELCLEENCPGAQFINLSIQESHVLSHNYYMEIVTHYRARELSGQLPGFHAGAFRASDEDQAAVIRCWDRIEGHCPTEKVEALFAIAPSIPPGDILEIGCLTGKSAYILLALSKLYGLGELLCIDPWDNAEAVQRDAADEVNALAHTLDFNAIHTAFCQNLRPFALDGGLNYLRLTSDEAARSYRPDLIVETPQFGRSCYTGQIACIHIDGNHDYSCVNNDIRTYSRYLAPGGWMIVDDYLWGLGAGPKQAADQYIKTNQESIEVAFAMGEALFIKHK